MKKIYSKITKERKEPFQIETSIVLSDEGEKQVYKTALSEKSCEHVKKMKTVYDLYCGKGLRFLNKCIYSDDMSVGFEFLKGKSINAMILEAATDGRKEDMLCAVNEYLKLVKEITETIGVEEFETCNDFVKVFGDEELPGVKACRGLIFDLIFDNVIKTEEGYVIIDYEWTFNFPVPVSFVIFRAMNALWVMHSESIGKYVSFDELMDIASVDKMLVDTFLKMDSNFVNYIYGEGSYSSVLKRYRLENIRIMPDAFIRKNAKGEIESPYKRDYEILDSINGVLKNNAGLFDDYEKFFRVTGKYAEEMKSGGSHFLDSDIFKSEIVSCLEDLTGTVSYYKDMTEKKDEICLELLEKVNRLEKELEYIKSSKVYKMGLEKKVDRYMNR